MSAPRLVPLTPDQMDVDQRRLYDDVLASPRGQGMGAKLLTRADGSIGGPFDAWLRSPILGSHFEKAGNAFRADTVYSVVVREIAILVVARAWSADFEWWVHRMMAENGGVPASVIDSIAERRRPSFEDEEQRAAHDVAFELVHRRRLSTSTLDHANATLGERAVVELVSLVGFYLLVSCVLEAYHPPGPDGVDVVGPPPMPDLAGIDLYEAASTTRSVRRLKPDPIPDDVLRRVLTAATWAPSGSNQQPWRVVSVKDPAIKEKLEELYAGAWATYSENSRKLLAEAPEDFKAPIERTLAAGDHLASNLSRVPVVNVFCFNPDQLHVTDAKLGRPSVVGGASLYPAVQNFLLACRAEGLGCVLTTLLCEFEESVRTLLAIPEPWSIHAMVPIGYPVATGHGPLARRPVEETVFGDRFGEAFF
jgi:nitroreductase/alkylhydroperoxidase family enzyme